MSKIHSADLLAENETCCMVTNAFGFPLEKGIVIVGISSIITSMAVLLPSLMFLLFITSRLGYNSHPMMAVDLMCALICSSTFLYQIVISAILLWFLQEKKYGFLLSLWFGSNVTLLVIFFILIVARSTVCFMTKEYIQLALTIFFGVIYEVVFSYFCMIVSSYESSLNPETIIF